MTTSEIRSALSQSPLYGKDFIVTGCSPVPTVDIRKFEYADSLKEDLYRFFEKFKSAKQGSDGQDITAFFKNVFDLAAQYDLEVKCDYWEKAKLYELYLCDRSSNVYYPASIAFNIMPKKDFLKCVIDVVAASYA